MEDQIVHRPGSGFFIEKDGKLLAEMTYAAEGSGGVILDHTWVSPELRGHGVARRLLDALVAWARETNTTVRPLCSYAVVELKRDSSLSDVLIP